jgi:hypothetical protein
MEAFTATKLGQSQAQMYLEAISMILQAPISCI